MDQNRTSSIYRTPDGEAVIVTCVNESDTESTSVFGDEVCVGEVTDWIQNIVNYSAPREQYFQYRYNYRTQQYEAELVWGP